MLALSSADNILGIEEKTSPHFLGSGKEEGLNIIQCRKKQVWESLQIWELLAP